MNIYFSYLPTHVLITPGAQSEPTGLCGPGYYCPAGSKFATEFGCPNGTYNNEWGKFEEAECKICTQGKEMETMFEKCNYSIRTQTLSRTQTCIHALTNAFTHSQTHT
jgi:hypothetical protein